MPAAEPRSAFPSAPISVPAAGRRGRPRRGTLAGGAPNSRDAILQSAAYLFATRGYDGASLSDIAAGAGATTGAIYAHFRGKAELLVEVIEETLAFLSFRTNAEVQRARDETSLAGYVRWLLRPEQRLTRELINEVFTAASRNAELQTLVSDYADAEADAVASMIEQWQAEGRCHPGLDPRRTATQFFTEVLGLCRIDVLSPAAPDDPRWVELAAWRVQQLLHEAPPRPRRRTRRR
jgi:AcrR family transcriptional regulator